MKMVWLMEKMKMHIYRCMREVNRHWEMKMASRREMKMCGRPLVAPAIRIPVATDRFPRVC
jgi:hypothetical protein